AHVHALNRQHPPLPENLVNNGDRDTQHKAEDQTESNHEVEFTLTEVTEDPHHQRRVLPEMVNNHQFGVQQLVNIRADLLGDVTDDVGELRLDACDDRLFGGSRQIPP